MKILSTAGTGVQVSQGFSLRDGSVSLMTISDAGVLRVGLLRKDKLLEKAQRIFEFGFAVGNDRVEIATITDSFKVRLKIGKQPGGTVATVHTGHDGAITRLADFDLNGAPAL
ncbi:MAG: hypothetical protein K2O09_03995 [Treponemataceae bacterium]|nr:hypothetical protein [Treponemataceae bacterium]